MPASIFNGAISFGLVSVPITVLSATEDHNVRFRTRAARGETGDAVPQEGPDAQAKKAAALKTARKASARAASSRNGSRGAPARSSAVDGPMVGASQTMVGLWLDLLGGVVEVGELRLASFTPRDSIRR
ncbi:hypothetical protein ACWEP4_39510 [Streptomyces sp. NPDC004227]